MLGLFDGSLCKQAVATAIVFITLSIEHDSSKRTLSIHAVNLFTFLSSTFPSIIPIASAHKTLPSSSMASFPEISSSKTTPKEKTSILVDTTPSAKYSGAM
ncbi:hypothetical protein OIU74_022672 [Salix koriyanagi]|uniref:Uncharacterized protein n=1 Tax=Salix koriyanagi TaxID=2511006 RepID=A0A9Q0WKT1_9ROSI|nr:hypothetical protein OIU74_022672 [Salix koriyanagi]